MNETNGVFSSQQLNSSQELLPGECQQTQEAFVEQESVKKAGPVKKFFAGVVVSFLIMGAFIGIQMVVAVIAMVVVAIPYVTESGGEVAYAMRMVQKAVTEPDFMTNLTAVATIVSAVFAVFFYWIIWGRKKTEQDKVFFREKVLRGKIFLMIFIAVFGLYFLSLLIVSIIDMISPATMENYEELMDMALGGNIWIAMLAAVILAPISEECIMRGLILKNLQKYFSVPAVIAIQAVLFGIFHMNWVQGIYVIPVGVAHGFVAIKCRSVLPSIYMHMCYNFMSVIVAMLPEFCQTRWFCILTVVVCSGLVWFLGKNDRLKEESL